ncbi:phospholipase D family protein [Demequina pelophila]|uniref:phospholipase D family protein n=1 Tax=Demequina pelophila TaxID=1638984 RepID=UPI000780F252|nr:phospholipase D family protein [Demequina pelophila]
MTLAPETRVLLTDALRPPSGFALEVAVGTTYSLNLTSLLLAPLSFAVHEQVGGTDPDSADPIALLESVRRYAERATVFCQAGGIDVPASYRALVAFVEDSVVEVSAPREGAIFHPKVWALRFRDTEGRAAHRAVILSRNLTQDRSWDTALVLDEDSRGTIPAEPLAQFVEALPGLALRAVDDARAGEIADLADGLARVRFAPPAGFDGGELLPIGIDGAEVWPFPTRARRLLAISPFLTSSALDELARLTTNRTLVSRQETLELVGGRAIAGWKAHVLQRLAEADPDEDIGEAERALSELAGAREGLHAKTFVLDLPGSRSMVVTGSANLTSRRWGNNVEFDAVLTGRTRDCGVMSVLDGTDDAPGLTRMLESATIAEEDGIDDASIAVTYAIEAFHRAIAERGVDARVDAVDGDVVEVAVTMSWPENPPGETRVWPISLPRDSQSTALAATSVWQIAGNHVTPFIAVETTAGEGDARVTRRCVIKATLSGEVGDRRQHALKSVLATPQDVLRYLVFLLGDPAYDSLIADLAGATGERTWGSAPAGELVDIALFEPMVRATGRDEGALARIASAVDEIRGVPDGPALPDGFDELWSVVWAVHQERRA